ncbi:hypothetical protein Tco_1210277 [Tanacetum coccineum]
MDSNDRSVWRDLFALSGLACCSCLCHMYKSYFLLAVSRTSNGIKRWMNFYDVVRVGDSYCVVLEYCYMWLELHVDKLGQKWNDVLCLSDRYAHGVCCVLDVLLDRKQGMTSLAKCAALKERVGGWEWADMMLLYSRNAAEEDSEFARRMGVLLQEMEAAYNERVDFIKELEAVPGVDAAVKTAEFLIDALWKDERRLQRLRKLQMDAHIMAYEKEKFTEKL